MILDNFLMFTGTSNGTSSGIASGANTDKPTTGAQTSTNIIDLHMLGIPVLASGQGARDIGIGDDPAMKLLVLVTATFTGGTSLQVALQGSPDNGSGAPLGFVTWWLSPVYAEATLVAGARLYDMDMPRPPAGVVEPRFLQMLFTSAGTHGAGLIEACIVLDRHDQFYNATANNILGGYPPGVIVAN
ncbi:MAG TPA: hypothetical protein VH187_05540 [Scandinavium sp.]|jgi:hypothetical protein|uniref:Bbp16 family capsid cement protein n=1 Tax=Scandinavium sp. TaxID=2830653 RepID=UPI002E2EFD30|nr:hypothetical protein [Scandinavium sp.]HEX4500624.1 hypothetical protein [Scandinavium sp.]